MDTTPVTFDQWIQIANAVGTWVAGIGTLAAVIVSLWLARGASRVRLKASVNIYWIVPGTGGTVPNEECVGFAVVNHGERAVIIDSVGWSIGTRNAKRFTLQSVERHLGADVPKRLEHDERASFMSVLHDAVRLPRRMKRGFNCCCGVRHRGRL